MPSTAMSSPRRPSTPGRVNVARASPPAMSTSALAVDPASDRGRAFPVPVTSSDRLPIGLDVRMERRRRGGRGGGRRRRRSGRQRGGLGCAAAHGQEQDHGGERRGRANESGHGCSLGGPDHPVKRPLSSSARAARIDRVDESGVQGTRTRRPVTKTGERKGRTEGRSYQAVPGQGRPRRGAGACRHRTRRSARRRSSRPPGYRLWAARCRQAWATPSLRQARGAATMAPSPDRGQEGGANAEAARRRCRDAPTALTSARDRSLAMVRSRKHTSSPAVDRSGASYPRVRERLALPRRAPRRRCAQAPDHRRAERGPPGRRPVADRGRTMWASASLPSRPEVSTLP